MQCWLVIRYRVIAWNLGRHAGGQKSSKRQNPLIFPLRVWKRSGCDLTSERCTRLETVFVLLLRLYVGFISKLAKARYKLCPRGKTNKLSFESILSLYVASGWSKPTEKNEAQLIKIRPCRLRLTVSESKFGWIEQYMASP